jgi:hypothetical protein
MSTGTVESGNDRRKVRFNFPHERPTIRPMSIKAIVEDFARRLQEALEGHATERARAAVLDAFGMDGPKRRGRPPKAATAVATGAKKPRKKSPPQFCPVPGCKNKAAPIFGMVCAKHKDVAKSLIKKYREARKAKKLKAAA